MGKKTVRLTENQLINIMERELSGSSNKEYSNEITHLNTSKGQLLEMARIDVPSKDNAILGTKEIWVYGQDRQRMTPHFHYFDNKNKQFSIEVNIQDLSVCFSQPRKGVPQNRLLSWYGLSNEYKVLKQWLKSPNGDIPSISNYQAIKLAWNQNNRDNPVELYC